MTESVTATALSRTARREVILDAAVETLRLEGVAGCTVRAIVERTPWGKSVLHYYFTDITEIVDLAHDRLTAEYLERLRRHASRFDDPVDAFWHTVVGYLRPFELHRSMPLLWVEYCTLHLRQGREEAVAGSIEAVREVMAEALTRVDPALAGRTRSLLRYLMGSVLHQSFVTAVPAFDSTALLIDDVRRVCDVPAPSVDARSLCEDAGCPLCRDTGARVTTRLAG